MNEIATAATGFIQGFSTDILILVVLGVILFFYGLYRGTHKVAALLVALYIGLLLYTVFPFNDIVIINKTWSHIVIWIIAVVSIKTILERLLSLPLAFSKVRTWIESGLLSVAVITSLIFILYGFFSFAGIYTPTLVSVGTLTAATSLFWTIVGSFAVLYYIAFW